jgi:hypothetical protein
VLSSEVLAELRLAVEEGEAARAGADAARLRAAMAKLLKPAERMMETLRPYVR